MISYIYNPFTGNLDAVDKVKAYSAAGNPVSVFPEDVIVVEHPPVSNMLLFPLVYEYLAPVGKTAIGYSMDWQGEYTQEVPGDISFISGSVCLRDNAMPATELYLDARDLATAHDLKTGTDIANDFVFVDDYGVPTTSYATATGLKTTGTTDSITFEMPELLNVPWNYYLNVIGKDGIAKVYKDNKNIGCAILESAVFDIKINGEIPTANTLPKACTALSDRLLRVLYCSSPAKYTLEVSYNNGVSWSVLNSNFIGAYELYTLPNDVVVAIVSSYKGIYRSIDKGVTFTPVSIPTAATSVIYPVFVNNKLIVYGYYNPFGEATNAQLFVSDDYGLTFTEKTLYEATYQSNNNRIQYVLGRYIITKLSSGVLYHSTDLTTWTKVSSTGATSIAGVFEHDNEAYIVGSTTYKTLDFVTYTSTSLVPFTPNISCRHGVIDDKAVCIDNSGSFISFKDGVVAFHMVAPNAYSFVASACAGRILCVSFASSAIFSYSAVISKAAHKNKVVRKKLQAVPQLTIVPLGVSAAWTSIADNGIDTIMISTSGSFSVSEDSGVSFSQKTAALGHKIVYCEALAGFISFGSNMNNGCYITYNKALSWAAHGTSAVNAILYNVVVNNIFYASVGSSMYYSKNNCVTFTSCKSNQGSVQIKYDDNMIFDATSTKVFGLITKEGQIINTKEVGTAYGYIIGCFKLTDDTIIFATSVGFYIYRNDSSVTLFKNIPTGFTISIAARILFHNNIIFCVNSTSVFMSSDFDNWLSVNFAQGEIIVAIHGFKNKVFIIVSNKDYCYSMDVPDTSLTEELVSGDILTVKSSSSNGIKALGISVESKQDTVTRTGASGQLLVKTPNYVNPRYFVTDSWDVQAHNVLSFISFTMSATIPSAASVFGLISLDDGSTWNTVSDGVLSPVTVSTLRETVNTSGVLLSEILSILTGLTPDTQKIKFLIDMRTTDISQTPVISSININYIQKGIYQKVPTGKGTNWDVYNMTETQTVFAYKGTQQTTALIHVLPL